MQAIHDIQYIQYKSSQHLSQFCKNNKLNACPLMTNVTERNGTNLKVPPFLLNVKCSVSRPTQNII